MCPILACKEPLHNVDLAGKFMFRQGLWIEDLRTPPGQECSNGSLILLAVVLWRLFWVGRDQSLLAVARARSPRLSHETPQG